MKERASSHSHPDLDDLYRGVLARDSAMLARAVTLLENTLPHKQREAQQLLQRLYPHTGNSFRIGISGIPGAGKSTFIEAFGKMLVDRGLKVAVLAIDPSSAITGGSILGDKTRMMELARSEHAFIRPTPSRCKMGGVGHKTHETILLCEAAGFDVVLVETVGVGQSEAVVADMVDLFLMVAIPGAGDDLQGIKRGILELIDLLVINKADGDRLNEAELAKRNYDLAFMILNSSTEKELPIFLCSSLYKQGMGPIWEQMQKMQAQWQSSGAWEQKRKVQRKQWMWKLIENRLMQLLEENGQIRARIPQLEQEVFAGSRLPFDAVEELFQLLFRP